MDVIYLFTYGQTGPGLWSRLPSRLSDTEWQNHRDKFITVWTNSSTNGEPWDNTDKRPSDKTFTMEGGILCTIGVAQRFPIMEQCSQRKTRSGSSKSSFKVLLQSPYTPAERVGLTAWPAILSAQNTRQSAASNTLLEIHLSEEWHFYFVYARFL